MNRIWQALLLAIVMVGGTVDVFSQDISSNTVATGATQTVTEVVPKSDPAAARFVNTCSGCHSLNGIKLTGPDLAHVAAWPEAQLAAKIKLMEAKVGPLPDADITMLATFLQSPDVRDRIATEGARIQAQFTAKLDVGSPARGADLFHGKTPLANGGLSCASCHQVEGHGGQLGPDLTGEFVKMGEMPLMSSLDKVGFKVMSAHYQRHPITRQEAVHLVAYLKTLNPAVASPHTQRSSLSGIGLAIAGFFLMVAYGSRGRVTHSRKLEYRKH